MHSSVVSRLMKQKDVHTCRHLMVHLPARVCQLLRYLCMRLMLNM